MAPHATAACDLLVVGSGGGGLTAAVTARRHRLDVLVVEKDAVIGGATAVSGGYVWIPCNSVSARAGVEDTREAARRYLEHEAGASFDAEVAEAFLENGPRMVEFLERETAVRFVPAATFPDYHPDAPGGTKGGRSILAEPYDGRALGDRLSSLRRPLRETTLWGLNVGSGTELAHFFKATRSPRSAAFVARRMAVHALHVLLHGRGMRLSNGNALTGRLLKTAVDMGVRFMVAAPVTRLETSGGRVTGAVVRGAEGEVRIEARRGVLLACGGFSHDPERKKALYPHVAAGAEHASAVPASNTGDGLRLGESAGGVVEKTLPNAGAWAPSSIIPYPDGTKGVFPHVIDRAKPGVIAVTRKGTRFVNESCSYHDFVQAMLAAARGEKEVCAFVVCDHRTIRRYGLGFARPFPMPLGPLVASGYLSRGDTLAELARRAGIDAAGLQATVDAFNADAREGRDRRFGKGTTAYNRFQGDPNHGPNPCVAPVERPPFYAVRMIPGDLGSFAGLRADRFGRVLDAQRRPIPGLYVAGNDMCSVAGGNYPGGGINIGGAMTFGYVAALHVAEGAGTRERPFVRSESASLTPLATMHSIPKADGTSGS